MNIYLLTLRGACWFIWCCAWFLGSLLHLHGRELWVLRIGLALIGVMGAGGLSVVQAQAAKEAGGDVSRTRPGRRTRKWTR